MCLIQVPYKPRIKDPLDMSNFQPYPEEDDPAPADNDPELDALFKDF